MTERDTEEELWLESLHSVFAGLMVGVLLFSLTFTSAGVIPALVVFVLAACGLVCCSTLRSSGTTLAVFIASGVILLAVPAQL